MDLHNRHVVVTGGSRGIGYAMGAAFAAAGARVTLVARTDTELVAAAQRIEAGYLIADLLDLPAVDTLVGKLEAIAPVVKPVRQPRAKKAAASAPPVETVAETPPAAPKKPAAPRKPRKPKPKAEA